MPTKEIKVQTPNLTHELYGGKVIIDFYDKFVTRGHAYTHVYINRKTGEWPLSVTSATSMIDKSRPLIIWAANLCKEFLLAKISKKTGTGEFTEEIIVEAVSQHQVKKEEGANIGDQVHKWIEAWAIGSNPEMPTDPMVLNAVSGFLKWFKEHDIEILANEQIVYSRNHDYVGKYDVMIRWKIPGAGNKKYTCIADFKTNNWKEDKKTGERKSVVYLEQRCQFAGYKGAYLEEHPKEELGPNVMIAFDKMTGNFTYHLLEDHEKDFNCFLAALTLKKRDKELAKGW